MISKIVDFFKISPRSGLMFICFLYCLVPFETANVAYSTAIRMCVATLLTMQAVVQIKSVHKQVVFSFFYLLLIALMAVINSFSLKFFATVSAIILGATCALATINNERYRRDVAQALILLIYLSVFLLFLQMMLWQLTGRIIDFHSLVFPFSEGRTEDHGVFARLGGLFIEPGTYANWIYAIYLAYLLLLRRAIGSEGVLVGVSLVLTMSLWGAGVGITIIVIYLLSQLFSKGYKTTIIYGLFSSSFVGVIIGSDRFAFFEEKLLFDSESATSKIDALEEFDRIFFDIFLLGKGFNPDFCINCVAPQDAGIAISFSVIMGLIPSVIIFAIIVFNAWRIGGVLLLFMILPLFVTKMFVWDYIFWIIFFVALLPIASSKYKEGNVSPSLMTSRRRR